MDPVDALLRLGGMATLGELLGPTTRARLRTAVAQGRVVHLKHDRYGLVDLSTDRRNAGAAGGVVSHLSAALAWDWKVKHPPPRTHVTVASGARRPTQDVVLHWAALDDSDVRHGVTSPVRTVIDCAKALPFESVVRAIALSVPGLQVEPQGEVPGVGWVDLLDSRLGLVIEADSHQFHGSLAGLRRDVKRYTACSRRGLVVVRFLWEEAMFHADYVREVLGDVTTLSEVRLAQARKGRRSP